MGAAQSYDLSKIESESNELEELVSKLRSSRERGHGTDAKEMFEKDYTDWVIKSDAFLTRLYEKRSSLEDELKEIGISGDLSGYADERYTDIESAIQDIDNLEKHVHGLRWQVMLMFNWMFGDGQEYPEAWTGGRSWPKLKKRQPRKASSKRRKHRSRTTRRASKTKRR